ncbi:MAG: hypothetical protein KY475_12550 [Planctomycetes bacterium]|nr:hypothetical protein [Planctomycetota bacterium]
MERRGFLGLAGWVVLGGCAPLAWTPSAPAPSLPAPAPTLENPAFVATYDREFLWNELVATVEQLGFRIEREDRVRQVGDVLVEGRIDTFPADSPTLLEPWRRGAPAGYERLESTLQSIRRRASVRVIPAAGGFLIEAVILKELEDVNRPERSTVGEATFRHDGALVRPGETAELGGPITLGWIPLGRDILLEQEFLLEVQSRLGGAAPLLSSP